MKMIDYNYYGAKQALEEHWLFRGTTALDLADHAVPILGWRRMDKRGFIDRKVPRIATVFAHIPPVDAGWQLPDEDELEHTLMDMQNGDPAHYNDFTNPQSPDTVRYTGDSIQSTARKGRRSTGGGLQRNAGRRGSRESSSSETAEDFANRIKHDLIADVVNLSSDTGHDEQVAAVENSPNMGVATAGVSSSAVAAGLLVAETLRHREIVQEKRRARQRAHETAAAAEKLRDNRVGAVDGRPKFDPATDLRLLERPTIAASAKPHAAPGCLQETVGGKIKNSKKPALRSVGGGKQNVMRDLSVVKEGELFEPVVLSPETDWDIGSPNLIQRFDTDATIIFPPEYENLRNVHQCASSTAAGTRKMSSTPRLPRSKQEEHSSAVVGHHRARQRRRSSHAHAAPSRPNSPQSSSESSFVHTPMAALQASHMVSAPSKVVLRRVSDDEFLEGDVDRGDSAGNLNYLRRKIRSGVGINPRWRFGAASGEAVTSLDHYKDGALRAGPISPTRLSIDLDGIAGEDGMMRTGGKPMRYRSEFVLRKGNWTGDDDVTSQMSLTSLTDSITSFEKLELPGTPQRNASVYDPSPQFWVRVLRTEREGELFILVLNSIRQMYRRMYKQYVISGAVALSLNSSLDLATDFALGIVKSNPIQAWKDVFDELPQGDKEYLDAGLREAEAEAAVADDTGSTRGTPRRQRRTMVLAVAPLVPDGPGGDMEGCHTRQHAVSLDCAYRPQRKGTVVTAPTSADATTADEVCRDETEDKEDDAPSKTSKKLTGFEIEWRLLVSSLCMTRDRKSRWTSFIRKGRNFVSKLYSRSHYSSAIADLQKIMAYVDAHEEILENGGESLEQLLGADLYRNFRLQIYQAKMFYLKLQMHYGEVFRYALVAQGTTLLLNLKRQMIEKECSKGLLLNEDREVLKTLFEEQHIQVSQFTPLPWSWFFEKTRALADQDTNDDSSSSSSSSCSVIVAREGDKSTARYRV